MNGSMKLNDSQWDRLLDRMAANCTTNTCQGNQQRDSPFTPFQFLTQADILDEATGLAGTDAPATAYETLSGPAEYSISDLRRLLAELEDVKQRLHARSMQVEQLTLDMRKLFEHLAELQPFLQEVKSILTEVTSGGNQDWVPRSSSQAASLDDESHGFAAALRTPM